MGVRMQRIKHDQNAIVVNSIVLRDEPDLKLGDEITLKIEGKEQPWQIVGVATGVAEGVGLGGIAVGLGIGIWGVVRLKQLNQQDTTQEN